MTLEAEVHQYIEETMGLEAHATTADLTDVRSHVDRLITGLVVMEEAILMVARRVDALETRKS